MQRIIQIFLLTGIMFWGYSDSCKELEIELISSTNSTQVENVSQKILKSDCKRAFEILTNFSLTAKRFKTAPFYFLADEMPKEFSNWVLSNSVQFSSGHWIRLARVGITDRTLESESFYTFLVSQSNTNANEIVREELRTHLYDYFRYSEVEKSQKYLKAETNEFSRSSLFGMNARFKSASTDSIINILLTSDERNVLEWVIEYPIKDKNRYDFLPELYALKKKIENIKDASEKSNWNRVLRSLDKTIPYLEEKKAEKAEIGLPLDWGTKREGSNK